MAVAIAMHNIPEGLSVAIPIIAGTNDKKKAFKISFLSGFAEPLGAILGLGVLVTLGILNDKIIELSLAFVSGIMVFISLDELLPAANETCIENGLNNHMITGGIITGMVIMIITLLFLE